MRELSPSPLQGTGLGLRRAMLKELPDADLSDVSFFEVAPENWMQMGGRLGRQFRALTEQHTFSAHGLSLSLGGPEPLDMAFVDQAGRFLDQHGILLYSEHLSSCSDHAHLYDLMPIPFTEEAVQHVATRIRQVQDRLQRRIAIENVSYYTPLATELSEAEFTRAVLEEADCDLLLDVNNIYVNSVNHRYDAEAFMRSLPAERVVCLHVAGHYQEAEDLLIDTHGAPIIDPVWSLLQKTYAHVGPVATLLERDFNLPPLHELMEEVRQIRHYQQQGAEYHDRLSA
ncbi:HvfB family MNIO-type RiPP peptide maturase [Marinobacterium stanieri]|uniref:UPF0276 protein SAMN05421647_106209 n=1 Tax=Marinobacterium stanieri TaxID=49186 RepID=A0A1N6U576_9GAMM|nr:DUF692 domain-containing protein [Marinobacterium stanieri]SIQ60764.1 hypothetical protein SAMN05421647_106209 [Marinobacterium stanieri]